MSFDYKQVQPPRPDSSSSFLIGLFFGFLLGLGVAAGIAIYFFKTPIPFSDRPKPADKPLAGDQKAGEPSKSAKAGEKPRFALNTSLTRKDQSRTKPPVRDSAQPAA